MTALVTASLGFDAVTHLLEQLDRQDEAGAEFRRAADLASNDRERALLRARAEAQGPSR